jgi:pimeloyl-ACP methyl ester carboxylesterase
VGDYSIRALASDVAAVIDSLQLTRVHVIGHSMGSLVAQHLVVQRAARVQSLVLIGSTRGGAYIPGMDGLLGSLTEFTNDNAPVSDAYARGFQESTLNVPVPPAFLDSTVQASLKLPLRVWKGLMTGLMADSGPPVRSGVRTMVMWGEKDAYMPRSEQTELSKLYNAPFVQFDSTGHAPHWERPEQAARTLVRFLNNEGVAAVK